MPCRKRQKRNEDSKEWADIEGLHVTGVMVKVVRTRLMRTRRSS